MGLQFGLQGVLGGIERKAQAKRVGKAALFNERTARRTAEEVSSAGSESEIRARRAGQKQLASVEARLAEAGIDSSSGLGLKVALALNRELEIEFGDIREQTSNERKALEDQAAGFARQRKDAKRAQKKAFFGLF
tara:strand:- start:190 stop:594 length:405 start_codon:yes stop_codon:yes gene_type:complete